MRLAPQQRTARTPKPQSNLHGILVVDKPGAGDVLPGDTDSRHLNSTHLTPTQPAPEPVAADKATRLPTSHDIVQKVRRWSSQRRIGHTGTLDPLASGVLILCLGTATRLVEYYQGHAKRYLAEISLGTATDTYDALGQVVTQGPVPPLTHAQIEAALDAFRGDVQQQPPVYSALKQGGESAHRRARRGEVVELAPRAVTFYELELVAFSAPNRIVLRAHCSAGTYIRSLAHDLGQHLGAPAHLSFLRREAAGPFSLADANSLAQIEAAAETGELSQLLLPTGDRLHLPIWRVDDTQSRAFGFGQQVLLQGKPTPSDSARSLPSAPDWTLAQARDENNQFLGIICRADSSPQDAQPPGGALWKAEKWLATGPESSATESTPPKSQSDGKGR